MSFASHLSLVHGGAAITARAMLALWLLSNPARAQPPAGTATVPAGVTVPEIAVRLGAALTEPVPPAGTPARSTTLTADPDWRREMLADEQQQQSALVQLSDTVPPDLLEQRGIASRQAAGLVALPATARDATPEKTGVRSFPSAEEAAAALVGALRQGNGRALQEILGPHAGTVLLSGDAQADRLLVTRFLTAYETRHTVAPIATARVELRVGATDWPLPLPIVQTAAGWQFDTNAGMQQLLARRLGRNEFDTMRVLLACVAAQRDYFQRIQAIDGKGFYATRIFSTRGRHDGLYWWVEPGQVESPLAPLIREARSAGYPGGARLDGTPIPYQGYFFRVLKRQGAQAPGGAKGYLREGKMTDGFALLAWPAVYGATGIMTFIAGPDGSLFQKSFGPQTATIAPTLTQFDPGPGWERIVIAATP